MRKQFLLSILAVTMLSAGCNIHVETAKTNLNDESLKTNIETSAFLNSAKEESSEKNDEEIPDEEFNKLVNEILDEKIKNYTPESDDLDMDESNDLIKDKKTYIDNYTKYLIRREVSDREFNLYKDHYFDYMPDDYLTSDMYLKPTKYYGGYRKLYKSMDEQDETKYGFTRGQVNDLDHADEVLRSFIAESMIHDPNYQWSNNMDKLIDKMDNYIASSNSDLHIDTLWAVDGNLERMFPDDYKDVDEACEATVIYSDKDIDGFSRLPQFKIEMTVGDTSRGEKGYGWGAVFKNISLENGGDGSVRDEYKDEFFDSQAEWSFDDAVKAAKESKMEGTNTEFGDRYFVTYFQNDKGETDMISYCAFIDGVMVKITDSRETIMTKEECEKLAHLIIE